MDGVFGVELAPKQARYQAGATPRQLLCSIDSTALLLTLRERCWMAADFSHSAQSSGFRVAESGAFRRSGRSNCRRWTSASESRALLYLTCATLMLE